ncbi:MAG: hypothetical protein DWQ04_14090, partial [Chloroflexi bacterium]
VSDKPGCVLFLAVMQVTITDLCNEQIEKGRGQRILGINEWGRQQRMEKRMDGRTAVSVRGYFFVLRWLWEERPRNRQSKIVNRKCFRA